MARALIDKDGGNAAKHRYQGNHPPGESDDADIQPIPVP